MSVSGVPAVCRFCSRAGGVIPLDPTPARAGFDAGDPIAGFFPAPKFPAGRIVPRRPLAWQLMFAEPGDGDGVDAELVDGADYPDHPRALAEALRLAKELTAKIAGGWIVGAEADRIARGRILVVNSRHPDHSDHTPKVCGWVPVSAGKRLAA